MLAIVVIVMWLLPSDPVLLCLSASQNLETMTPEQIQKTRQEYGQDKPLMVQYGNGLGGVLRVDLRTSISLRS